MTFFESLLALLFAAIVLLQIARRLALPYPAMLAAAGVLLALVPGSPSIPLDPATALPLFIAPAVVDSAFDYPLGATRRFRSPIFALAVVAVVVTASLVAWLAHTLLGTPWAASIALGAIVAPPDAAAAAAILSAVSIPRSTDAVLKGESLFNDATALLLFSAALAVQTGGGLHPSVVLRIGIAAPGGVLLGILLGLVLRHTNRFVTGTLGGNLLQFVYAYFVWLLADRLQLSAVLCTIALAMTLANSADIVQSARMRVQSYAVWSAVVFVLNVFAFLLMGMQGRSILHSMPPAHLREALHFAALVVLAVVLTRILVVLGYNRLTTWLARRRGQAPPATLRQVLFVGWSGMRGFVTLATAFALPENFPARDTLVLTAFAVVLCTLVVQGLTLNPLVRLLHLDQTDAVSRELIAARIALSEAALEVITDEDERLVQHLQFGYRSRVAALRNPDSPEQTALLERKSNLGLRAIHTERERLEALRADDQIGPEIYLALQEEIDWRELSLLPDADRRIEEI